MKKQITIITLGIIMIAGVMAMYAGDTISFQTNLTNPVYTVTGNTSSLEGLNITFENGNVSITPQLNYKPDNFTLIFLDNITNEVIKTISVGGGNSKRIVYVDKNVTVYIPQYINTTKEVEVEKIVDNTTVLETGYELWHILLGLGLGVAFGYFMIYKKKDNKSEDILEEVGDGTESE